MKFIVRMLIASLALFLLGAARNPSWGEAASALLVSSVLCWITARSRASGAELVATLACFYFILSSLAVIPEGVLFDVIKVGQAPLLMVQQLGIALVMGIFIVSLFQRSGAKLGATPTPGGEMSIFGLAWRLVAAVAVFTACYVAAGMIIYPMVKTFYQGRNMPEPGTMIAAVVLKAAVLIIAGWLVLRSMPRRGSAVAILSTAFPVVGVLSLMLHPNELMPPSVRWVHTMEMVPYYALFGLLLAIWFGPPRAIARPPEEFPETPI